VRTSCLTAACLLCTATVAADPVNDAQDPDTMIITATRTRVAADEVLVPVIVIDRATIERSGALDLADLLRFQAGIEIARNGGPGSTTSVFTRGTDSNHTLVLMDGVAINPGTIGGAGVQDIAPDLIERVEIVKGPRSSLYGSEAVGGVINIITRTPNTVSAEVGAGRYDQQEVHLAGGARGARGDFGITVDAHDTDGFPPLTASDLARGYDNVNGNVKGGIDIGHAHLGGRYWQTSGNAEYLDFFLLPADQDFDTHVAAVDLDVKAGERWDTTITLSRLHDDIEQNQSANFVRTDRDTLDWQNTLRLAHGHELVAGLQLSNEETAGETFGTVLDDGSGDGHVDTDVYEAYLSDNFDIGAHSFMVAARYTDHSTFGTHDTWNVEYGYPFTGATRMTAGIGTAFRAPDSTDRYGFGGNPDLKPETSRNIEVGVRHRIGANQTLSLQAFDDRIDDLIDFVQVDQFGFVFEARNVDEARIRGVEATYALGLDPWHLRVGATLQDPEDTTTGEQLLRRAQESLTASVTRRFGRQELGLDLLWAGERKDFGFPEPVALNSYTVVNLTGGVHLGQNWTLRGNIENLFDEDYDTAAGYRSSERAFHLRLGYSLKP
jgi:vitamin B12 transporter